MGDPTDIVELGPGHGVSADEGQRRVARQRRVAACPVVVGLVDSLRELGIRDPQAPEWIDEPEWD